MEPLSRLVATLGLAVALVAPASTAAQGESPEARELAGLTFWPAAYEFPFTNAAQMGAIAKAGLEGVSGRPRRLPPRLESSSSSSGSGRGPVP